MTIGMSSQYAGRIHIAYRLLEAILQGPGFTLIRYRADDMFGSHYLPYGHADGRLGNICDGGEPAFTELLLPAGFVQRCDDIRLDSIKIRRRIIECQVAILSDARERHVDGMCIDQC